MNTEEVSCASDLLELTTSIVTAYLSNNPVPASDLPALIASVHSSLGSVGKPVEVKAVRAEPAVPIRNSVREDYIVCLEDGKRLKMLKRHLKSAYGMTPEQYRERWNLPSDYPMTAPSYAEKRSVLAKSYGLGKSNTKGRRPRAVA